MGFWSGGPTDGAWWSRQAIKGLVFLTSLILLPITHLALELFGFRFWQTILCRILPQTPPVFLTRSRVRMIHQGHRAAVRLTCGPNCCLRRSLVLWWLLRCGGPEATLRIGVRKVQGRLQAHAWVEWHGEVVNDSPDVAKHFQPFPQDLVLVGDS